MSRPCDGSFLRSGMRRGLALVISLLEVPALAVSGEAAPPGHKPLRQLQGAELGEFWRVRDEADRLRADYDAKYLRLDAIPPGEVAAFRRCEAAYKAALSLCEGADGERYVRCRLAGLYAGHGDADGEAEQYKELARRFPGTEDEMSAYFNLGVTHSQRRGDPKEAMAWLEKVHVLGSEKLYCLAQQEMAKCEVELGNPGAARQRYERLMAQFPQWKRQLADALKALLEYPTPRAARGAHPPRAMRHIEPDTLFTPVLTERTPLDELLSPVETDRKAAAPERAGTSRIEPAAPTPVQRTPGPAKAGSSLESENGPQEKSRLDILGFPLFASVGLAMAILSLILWRKSRKETRQ